MARRKGVSAKREPPAPRILREVDESLARLRTDYIDLYQVHWPDPGRADGGNRRSDAARLYEQGKILAIRG